MNCSINHFKGYTVATDLKLCSVLFGIINHCSYQPFVWYNTTKDDFRKNDNERTIAKIMKLFWDFFEYQGKKKDTKKKKLKM